MNTTAHLIVGAAGFGRKQKAILLAALFGSLVPDLSLYLLAGVSLFVLNLAPNYVFGELYYSDAWQFIFGIDNSMVIWGVLFAGAIFFKNPIIVVFSGAGLLHLLTDFLLHHDDGRKQFWPLTDWVFESPVSYWDKGHNALLVAPIIAAVCVLAAFILLRRHESWPLRVFWLSLMSVELMMLYGLHVHF